MYRQIFCFFHETAIQEKVVSLNVVTLRVSWHDENDKMN